MPGLVFPWVAALLGALAGNLLALPLGRPIDTAAAAILGAGMAAIAVEDFRAFRVPDLILVPLALAGLAWVWLRAPALAWDFSLGLPWAALSAIICGGMLWLLREAFYRFRGLDGLGLGDVKLASVAGLWLGLEAFPFALMAGALAALALVVVVRVSGRDWPADRRIPLAVFLAPAIFGVWAIQRLAG